MSTMRTFRVAVLFLIAIASTIGGCGNASKESEAIGQTAAALGPAPGSPTLTFRMRSVKMANDVQGLFVFDHFDTLIGTTDIASDDIFECNHSDQDPFFGGPCQGGVTWYYPNDLNGTCGPPLSTCVAEVNRFPESKWKHTAVVGSGPDAGVGAIPILVTISPAGSNPSQVQFQLTATRDASGAAIVTPDASPQTGLVSLTSTCATTTSGFTLCWSVDFGVVPPPLPPPAIDFPMNVESDALDPNGLPLDPLWRMQRLGAQNRGNRLLCGVLHVSDGHFTNLGDPECTNQAIYTNLVGDLSVGTPPLPPGPPLCEDFQCLCQDERAQGLNGHANWPTRVTVQGLVDFDEWDRGFGHDFDFNIMINPPNQGLLTVGHSKIKIEFNSDETIQQYNGPGWLDYYDNQHIVDGHAGIVTGVFGLDGVHAPEGPEIHPGLALSINLMSGDQCGPLGPGAACKTALSAVAVLFHESPDELDRELAAGQSLGELATQKGISQNDLINAVATGAFNGSAQDICGTGMKLVCDPGCELPTPCVKPECHCEAVDTPPPLPPPTPAEQLVAFHHVHNVDRQIVFARAAGNEGNCSSNQEVLDLSSGLFKVRYPWKGPKGGGVTVVANTEELMNVGGLPVVAGGVTDVTIVQDESILVSYSFFPSALSVNGDMTFVYGSGPVFDLHRQYTSQGNWADSARFLSADFTGDGLPDTAYMFNQDGQISIDVHVNNGDGTFTLQRWISQAGGWLDTGKFLVSDFDGDGRNDIAFAFNQDGFISIDVYPNLGNGHFGGQQRWQSQNGGWLDGGRFMAADFTGDGHVDIAFAFNADGVIDIDVHPNGCTTSPSTCTRAFAPLQRWSTGVGDWADTASFLPGDFTGDGRPDIAYAFNQDDFISIDIHPNTGSAFGPQQRWATQSGGWLDSAQFLPGDFNGDGRLDIAYAFREQHDDLLSAFDQVFNVIGGGRTVPPKISIDIHSNILGGTFGRAFGGPERWGRALGGWVDATHFMQGDFDGDGALDIADAFNCDGQICQDLHRNLDVPAASQPPVGDSWVPGKSYNVGDRVVFDGIVYECQQAHTSQVGWEPPNTPALWVRPTPSGLSNWAPQTRYVIGSLVRYGGNIFSCTQAHQSFVGAEPPNAPSLWTSTTSGTCTPESDGEFCSRLGKNCDSVTANDNCGTPRTVSSCGTCIAPQTCGGGGTANVCGSGGGACTPTVSSYTLGKCNATAVFNGKLYKCISQATGVNGEPTGCGSAGVYCSNIPPTDPAWGITAWQFLQNCP